jgi:hypothetical protein
VGCGTALLFLCFCSFPLHHCFLAKNINKTIELLKYKIYQKARRNRPKNKTIFYSSTCKINGLWQSSRICCCLDKFWVKACKIAEKKLEKDTGIYQTHRKRQQQRNISLESIFNSSDNNCFSVYYIKDSL